MIAALVALVVKAGIPARFAKPVLIGLAVVLLIAALGIGKCSYDRSVIRNHTANERAATAEADRKADTRAADQRRVDDARAHTERTEITDAIEEARSTGADPRAAYYECVSRQQAARRDGKPPADC
ncbi:hypothetical protein [Sphingomonas sp. LHG3406-1]|uniref:hypothetical protein n=1 Tax=Sphingomonas sp. LHG3406-1 TaxID=2804617 RepID=UPI002616EA90|nr:hypothetical protein [Sphingomonas sp. LHG3406-1]